jgi:hypothetical protein
MRTQYGYNLRKWLKENVNIEAIYDFGDLQVFEEATTYPCLLQIQKGNGSNIFMALEIDHLDFEDLTKYIYKNCFRVNQDKLLNSGWSLMNKEAQNLLEKLKNNGTTLKQHVHGKIHYGIKTGLNKAFVIDKETKEKLIAVDKNSKDLIKPFLSGRDIKRYQVPKPKKYVILVPSGWTNSQTNKKDKWKWFKLEYPAIANYLEQFKARAKRRSDKGNYWWELRPCDYYDAFKKPKIMYQVFQVRACFTYLIF